VANVGYATLQVIPSFKGAEAAITQGLTGAGGSASEAGTAVGGMFGKGLGAAASAAAPVAVAGAALAIGKQLYDLGSRFDAVYDRIRTNTGATGKSLEGLEADFRSVVQTVPTDFDSAGLAIEKITTKLDLTGKPLRGLSEQFLEVSRITGTDLSANLDAGTNALANWGIPAGEMPGKLDLIFRATQQSGLSFTDLSSKVGDAGVVLRGAGLSFDESTALIATLGKAGVDVSEAMPAIGKAMAKAASEGKPASELFRETFAAIKNAPNEVDGAGIAYEVFGAKAGPKFAKLIQEGKLSYEEMLAQIQGGNETIRGAGSDTQDFGEKWQILKNQVFVALEPIATKLFAAIADGMTWITEHKREIKEFFQGIASAVEKAWIVAKPIYQALFGQIKAWVALIDDLIHGRWGEIWGDLVGIVKAAIGLLIAPFKGLIALFGWDKIKAAVSDGIGAVVGFFAELPGKVLDALGDLAGWLVQKGLDLLTGLLTGLGNLIGDVTTFFVELPGKILGWIGDLIGTLAGKGADLIRGLILGYAGVIGDVTTFFVELAGNVLEWIGDTAVTLIEKGAGLIRGLISGYLGVIGDVTSFFVGLAGQVFGWIGDTAGTLVSKGGDLIRGFIMGYVGVVGDVLDFFYGLPLKILDKVGDLGETLLNAGKALMRGLLDGIRDGFGAVKDFVGGIAGKLASIKGPLDYDRKLLVPAGNAIMAGLLDGSRQGFEDVARFYSEDVTAGLVPKPTGVSPHALVGAGARGGVVQNFNGAMHFPRVHDADGVVRVFRQIARERAF